MSNHYHIVLKVDRERARALTDDEVLARWSRIFTGPPLVQRYLDPNLRPAMDAAELDRVREYAALYRERLSDLSWYMRVLNEGIARKANQEDGLKGRFWEGRFKSQALLDEQALLAAMAYVDLNPIRAGIADTPERSDYTSLQARLLPEEVQQRLEEAIMAIRERQAAADLQRAVQQRLEEAIMAIRERQAEDKGKARRPGEDSVAVKAQGAAEETAGAEAADGHQSSLRQLWEKGGAVKSQTWIPASAGMTGLGYSNVMGHPSQEDPRGEGEIVAHAALPGLRAAPLMPFDATGRETWAIPFAWPDYLELVETLGRCLHPEKRGRIPEGTPRLLERLGIDTAAFIEHGARFLKEFGSAVGKPASLIELAARRQAKFLWGMRAAQCLTRRAA